VPNENFTKVLVLFFGLVFSINASATPLARKYKENETLEYKMVASNRGQDSFKVYTALSSHEINKDTGVFFEDVQWKDLTINGDRIDLTPWSSFRQKLSLDKDYIMPFPDISKVHRGMIGPIFDLMTFYADLSPSIHQNKLLKPGDKTYFKYSKPSSWADGKIVIIGEDCIDFDFTLGEVTDTYSKLVVEHVSPKTGVCIQIPAEWMSEPVTKEHNNWVQVVKNPKTGEFEAGVGYEYFKVDIKVDAIGKILSAFMNNPVQIRQKTCSDIELLNCGPPVEYEILRQIRLDLVK